MRSWWGTTYVHGSSSVTFGRKDNKRVKLGEQETLSAVGLRLSFILSLSILAFGVSRPFFTYVALHLGFSFISSDKKTACGGLKVNRPTFSHRELQTLSSKLTVLPCNLPFQSSLRGETLNEVVQVLN